MMKFDIILPQYAFKLCSQSNDGLFSFGIDDISVFKENEKAESWCDQCSYEYKGISNALCGKQLPYGFTPKRIIVIEMK
ncbi:hypothetical protein KM1_010050 [Entamoeba histolytica HM-3:IMSS]|uniref:Uncharacterized protein n=1 Tax=Entamoeba histolytica HM-3:IMSS TaxID=885315 RepID=M7W964_ENTHI|nr:hypothetical protein KM1_010050 [Entamoeba histolytica HM-3:IMSS]